MSRHTSARLSLFALSFAALALPLLHSADPTTDAVLTNAIGLQLRLVPSGKFRVGTHEVTQEQYAKVAGHNPSWFHPKGPGLARVKGLDTAAFPVEMVSFDDALDFCQKLSTLPAEKKAGRVYRLPTEAEWEYACRAGSTTEFHHGDRLSSDEANFHGFYPHGGAEKSTYLGRTCKVGSYPANAWGLYDMHGNVWEWCSDWFVANSQRALRGGSWYGRGRHCASSHRAGACPTERYHNIGFRVVCDEPRR